VYLQAKFYRGLVPFVPVVPLKNITVYKKTDISAPVILDKTEFTYGQNSRPVFRLENCARCFSFGKKPKRFFINILGVTLKNVGNIEGNIFIESCKLLKNNTVLNP